MSTISAVKGTRDFYPADMAVRDWLYETIRTVSEQFGYQEFEGPYLEKMELYAAKSGEELVNEQSFVFEDRGGDIVALRPELTPTLARMVAARSRQLIQPIRWWSFGPFWRYERPQKGRSREFFQWNIDLLGIVSPQADAELAAIAATFFRAVGLTPKMIRIQINNRRFMDTKLEAIGIPLNSRPAVFHLIDRKDKMSERAWQEKANSIDIDKDQFSGLLQLLENKDAWKDSDELCEFFDAVEIMGVADYIEYDPMVIRGLDYYTGTVFEARDVSGRFRAILGGGRYDNLVADVGGDPIPGVGFAMGDIVIGIVLEENGVMPSLKTNPSDVFVPLFDEATLSESLRLAAELRTAGLRVEWYPQPDKLKKQFKYADRNNIPLAVILGPDEIQSGKVTIKDLRTVEQETVARSEMIDKIKNLLSADPPSK
ncbi:MAG: histidine--tRNA ligase [Anaerolineales bacterium]|jgi:histidyl-tRNA synthetase